MTDRLWSLFYTHRIYINHPPTSPRSIFSAPPDSLVPKKVNSVPSLITQFCPYFPPICAQKLPRAERWIWVTVNNPPDHKGILLRSILRLPVVTIWIVETTIFIAQFFSSALSSSNTLLSVSLVVFLSLLTIRKESVCLLCFILTAAPLRACAAGSRLWRRLMLASM